MWSIALLLALASAPIVLADSAVVHNKCDFPIYLWSVSDTSGPMVPIASGGNYSEIYKVNPNGGGISLKISPSQGQTSITQFEYTVDPKSSAQGKVWFDLSNVNGSPFAETNLLLESANAKCETVVCPAGEVECKQAYTRFNDDYATHACTYEADLVLSVCAAPEHMARVIAATTSHKRDADANAQADLAESAVTEALEPRHVHAHIGRSRLFRF